LSEFLQFVNLKENPGEYPADLKMISILINDHEDTIKYLRKIAVECEEEYADA
jgi:starvation-inducible DNA-binding protein